MHANSRSREDPYPFAMLMALFHVKTSARVRVRSLLGRGGDGNHRAGG